MKKELTYKDIKLGSWVKIDGKPFLKSKSMWVIIEKINHKNSFCFYTLNKYGEKSDMYLGETKTDLKVLEIGKNNVVKRVNRVSHQAIVIKHMEGTVDDLRNQFNIPSNWRFYYNKDTQNHTREITFHFNNMWA
jgi:hypothetical protein